ncbi:MAG: PadR family transcriptional regulator [Cyanothece sp. SIO1E1]|nr:PadR family transcriptional regulator [Cyanothece sp. SIO1E1]
MELMQGTLDMLILRILVSGKKHGLDISKTILLLSNESLQVGHGSMYPALHRLEQRGFTRSTRAVTEKGRTAKYYELTELGREQVADSHTTHQHQQSPISQRLSDDFTCRFAPLPSLVRHAGHDDCKNDCGRFHDH